MIDLNELSVRDKFPVFNNGKAGEVIASINVSRKKPEDKDNYPDWRLEFKDGEDRVLPEGFYYLDPTKYTSEDKYKAHLKYEASRLKHVINCLYGDDFQFPGFQTPKDMLDGCMQLIAAKNGSRVKIGVTFGTIRRPSRKGYLQLKSTFPFITANLDSEIPFNNQDLLERPQPTAPVKEDTPDEKMPWD